MESVHGTVVALDGSGVLLRGPSGSGKSDLALRLIDAGAVLVADDHPTLTRRGDRVEAAAPDAIRGKIEVRGVGIVELPQTEPAVLRLVVDLVTPDSVERLPKPAETMVLGVALPVVNLAPFEASAPAKVRLALRLATREIER